ncbi:GNAT family N-acetyltransferase [Polynucleobacter arcticus]|uniref:GNAT family N-acetyltransferase n=1 Tax=Polynucleobacter arcticus TaxID=1743165 RepID=A0A6M9PLF8_9BURK|nr:GNAT family N-acetyltransferase [Polynucleobacter arcticus]QKM60772.1 GNAT family N-acetyltransferase [Polynucleobacter arcticus]
MILIKPWKDALKEAYPIRKTVFIEEQGVPESMELDEFDPLAQHALAYQGSHCIGTARLILLPGHQGHCGQIGRMAVLSAYRNQGVGGQLLHALLEAGQSLGIRQFKLHAQLSAIPFYELHGFIAQGDIYDEAGIAHRDMICTI